MTVKRKAKASGVSFVRYSTTNPSLTWCTLKRVWVLKEPITIWFVTDSGDRLTFTVPVGFETDLASIPRLCRSFIPQVGAHILAAIVHDWCYRNPSMIWMAKEDADLLFRKGMEQAGVGRLKRSLMYGGVKYFGASSYQPGIVQLVRL